MKRITYLTLLVALCIALPVSLVYAQAAGGAPTLLGVVNTLVTNLSGLGAGLATIGFIVSGILYIMSTVNPSLMNQAKTALVAAVIGIVIILLSATANLFVKNLFGL